MSNKKLFGFLFLVLSLLTVQSTLSPTYAAHDESSGVVYEGAGGR